MEQRMIMVGTPCYGGMLHQDYVSGIIEYGNAKLPIAYMHIGNESLITRGRNTIISYFYHNMDKFSHLLYLDADVYLSAKDLVNMLNSGKDVIAAPVPLKGLTPEGKQIYNVTNVIAQRPDSNLMEVERVGTAAFLLSKKAVEALVEDAKSTNDTYRSSPLSRGVVLDIECYDVFKAKVVNGIYLSEDFYVCHKLRELGFKVFVDKTISTRHSGTFTFVG